MKNPIKILIVPSRVVSRIFSIGFYKRIFSRRGRGGGVTKKL